MQSSAKLAATLVTIPVANPVTNLLHQSRYQSRYQSEITATGAAIVCLLTLIASLGNRVSQTPISIA